MSVWYISKIIKIVYQQQRVSQPVCLFVWLSVCLSNCLSLCLFVFQSVCLLVCLSVCLFVCSHNFRGCVFNGLFVSVPGCLFVCLFVWHSIFLFVYLYRNFIFPVCLSVYLLISQSFCQPVSLSASLSVCLSVCLFVCLLVGWSVCFLLATGTSPAGEKCHG